jgi:hypothetical protein
MRWLVLAMLLVTAIGELLAWQACNALGFRFPALAIGAVCVGLTATVVSLLYDGHE